MTRLRLPRRRPTTAVLAVGALVLAAQVVASVPAQAATPTFTVSTTADVAANTGACGNSSITTAPSPLSLREATCLANNVGGTVTITVPSGFYNLANGELAPGVAGGANVSIVGAGAATTVINAGGLSRVFNLDKLVVGGITNTISGVTIKGGADSVFGGAGIIGGSGDNATADTLTLNNVVVTGNAANGANMAATTRSGGGVQFLGGRLTITNSTFSNNTSGSSEGSGVAYGANGQASSEGLTIVNSTFAGNAVVNTSPRTGTSTGGALSVYGQPDTDFVVTGSRFSNNTATSTNGSGPAVGGAIWQQSGRLLVESSTFIGNSVSGGTAANVGGAIETTSGEAALRFNRIVGNIAPAAGGVVHSGDLVNAKQNWWGCNTGPGTVGCDTTAGSGLTSLPWLQLAASASPATVVGPNASSTITAALVTDSFGNGPAGANLGAFAVLPVTFSDPPGDATVTLAGGSHTAAFSAGKAAIDYHSGTVAGPNPVNVTFDNQTVSTSVTVNQAPSITSANTANFRVGQAGSFTVTTTGYPTAAISRTGTLPAGLTFTDNGNGTATVSGTATSGGTFPLSLTANNGVNPNATQTLTITVNQAPSITSPNTATFTAGVNGSFTITTSGSPTATLQPTGDLPAGLSFAGAGNGSFTLSGTPAANSGGTYPVTLTAGNGVSPDATQTLTVQVNQAPTVTTNPSSQTVNPGTSVSFTAAASGVPTPTVQWQRSTNGGASWTNIAGATSTTYAFTAAAGDNGNTYRAVFSNVAGTAASNAATLTVGTAPAFTSANSAVFTVGTPGRFPISTSGVPRASLSRTGAQFPAWLTLSDNADGTGTLTGTPPAGSGGLYTFTLKATNSISPSASQTFTLQVDQSPVITSADHATFTAGSAGSFTVTAAAGFPTATSITRSGALPTGLSFTDNGNGTATLAGTPTSGGVVTITVGAAAVGSTAAPATQTFTLTVNAPPTITSADRTTFTVGTAGTFTVRSTAGYPAARTLTRTGTLPSGVTFTDNGDGTATLAGTPATGAGGVYPLTIMASNGIAANATQTFTLTVREPARITSADHVTFARGTASTFTVTTAPGQPAATTFTATGALPPGVVVMDNGDGTATLGGTPTRDGVFALTITASNGVSPDSVQTFTLTVTGAPTITSADHATFAVGAAGSVTVTTTAGTPAATTLTADGDLPDGVTVVDNGDGTATLAGTPKAGSSGTYPVTITAANSVASATQDFVLTVTALPAITSASSTTFGVGAAGTFTVTTRAGFPAATTLTASGSLPDGVTFVDNGDGTASLAGTPAAGAGGSYPLTVTAANTAGDTDQSFTLLVTESPVVTSADKATFTTGTAGTFTVTTGAGFPSPPTLAVSGDDLPSGLSFVDNGDGTATLAGTPGAGEGGRYDLVVTAHNGTDPDASQPFTLVVNQAPAITSAASGTFTVGTAGSFTVTTSGYPTPSLAGSAALPDGVSFTDNGDGTATLAGTPTAAGDATVVITAANGTDPDATQDFTLHAVKAEQTITVTSTLPSPALVGGTYEPTATSDSGLPVTVTIDASTTDSACSFVDGVVSLEHAGTCVVDFDQAGNGTYQAAGRVQQSFTVATITTGVGVTTTASPTVFGQPVRATAVVTAGSASPAGTVRFAVDGTALGDPVTIAEGTAQSDPLGAALAPGSHVVTAAFTPDDTTKYATATGTVDQLVNQAATTTALTVQRTSLTATVTPKAPGAGTPTGPVTFTVGGRTVGTVALSGGTATLTHSVPTGQAQQVGATYAGDANFTMSSASTARTDPKIVATVTSTQPRTKYGWYRAPVTITFRCTTAGAPLTAPCPAPAVLGQSGAARTVSRTITATDGGTSSVVVRVNLDRIAPTVRVGGVRNGATYLGSAPGVGCVGSDRLSGLATCTVTTRANGTAVSYRVTATDRAGNTVTAAGSYRVLKFGLSGASYVNGAYDVKIGRTYTLVAYAGSRPTYYDAAVYPRKPTVRDHAFNAAGRGRWALGVTMDKSLRGHTYWNLGVKVGKTMYVVRIRV